MSLSHIPSLQSVGRAQPNRNPSVGSLSRGREANTLYELTRTQVQLTQRNSFTDLSNTKTNFLSSRQEIKKEGATATITKPIIMRSLSVVKSSENKPKLVKAYTHAELGRDTLAEKKEKHEKKFELWKKINEIKASLLRSCEPDEQKVFPLKSSLKRVFECLEVWNDTESNLSELMSLVVSTLKSAIYTSPKLADPLIKLSEAVENEELRNLGENLENNNVTYYSVVTALMKELVKQTAPKPNAYKDFAFQIQQLEQVVEAKTQAIENLQCELDSRIPHEEHQRLLNEIEVLKKRLTKTQVDYTKLLSQHEELKNENVNQKRTIADDVDQIEALSCKNSDLECDKENLQLEVDKYVKKILQLQESLTPLKDFKDKIIMKLSLVKKQMQDLRIENEKLSNSNRDLSVRAACGFDGLTPRPNYRKLPVWGEVEACLYSNYANQQLFSTNQIFENLVNKLMGIEPNTYMTEQKENKSQKKSRSRKRDGKESPQIPTLKSMPTRTMTRTAFSLSERKYSNLGINKTTNTVYDDAKKEVPISRFFTVKTAGDEDRKLSLPSGRRNENNLSVGDESVNLLKCQEEKDRWEEEDGVEVTNDLLDYLVKTSGILEKVSKKV